MRDTIEANLARQGYSSIHHKGPKVLLRDPATGELFDSLTDQSAIFADYNATSWESAATAAVQDYIAHHPDDPTSQSLSRHLPRLIPLYDPVSQTTP